MNNKPCDILPQEPKCPKCGGIGRIEHKHSTDPDLIGMVMLKCLTCNGIGKLQEPKGKCQIPNCECEGSAVLEWPKKQYCLEHQKDPIADCKWCQRHHGINETIDICLKVHQSVVEEKNKRITELEEEVKSLNKYGTDWKKYYDEQYKKADLYKNVLLELKNHNNHTIEEEMWRIDKVLKGE